MSGCTRSRGTSCEEVLEVVNLTEALAAGDRDCEPCQRAVTLQVKGLQGLLNPAEPDGLTLMHELAGCVTVVALVDIDHQRQVVAQLSPQRGQDACVGSRRDTTPHFDPSEVVGDVSGCLANRVTIRLIADLHEWTAGVRGDPLALAITKQLRDRSAFNMPTQIPQCDVNRAECQAVGNGSGSVSELAPDGVVFAGRAAKQSGGER